jgi:hypothetical protein
MQRCVRSSRLRQMVFRHQSRSARFHVGVVGMATMTMLGGCALLEDSPQRASGAGDSGRRPVSFLTQDTYNPFSGAKGTIGRDQASCGTNDECTSRREEPADSRQRGRIGEAQTPAVYVPAGEQAIMNAELRKCPTDTRQAGEIIMAIRDAPSCKASYYVMRACRFDTAGDVQLARAVVEKCEATFLSHLSPDHKSSYQRAREACVHKYINMQGPIYASYQATCDATVAVGYAWRWGG